MPTPKAFHMCQAELDGQPCRLQHGQPHHRLLEDRTSGLGLPMPVHELANGTQWTVTTGVIRLEMPATTTVTYELYREP